MPLDGFLLLGKVERKCWQRLPSCNCCLKRVNVKRMRETNG